MPESLNLPVKNLVLEWRFAPQLRIYTKMDEIGATFSNEYPDWQRSPLTLEIRSKKRRRRFFMSHRRCFFDVIVPADTTVSAEIDKAYILFDRLAHELNLHDVKRLGLRQWIAVPKDHPFEALVKQAIKKFHPADNALSSVLQAEFADIGYVVDLKTADGWKYNLRAGPMKKDQWFTIVPHEPQVFPEDSSWKEYKDAFPDQFFYMDIDCYHESLPKSDARQLTEKMKRTAHDVAHNLNRYFDED